MEINLPHVYLQYLTITVPLSYQSPCGSFDHRTEGRISLCLFSLRILTFGRVFALLVLCQSITGPTGCAKVGEDEEEKAPIRESCEKTCRGHSAVLLPRFSWEKFHRQRRGVPKAVDPACRRDHANLATMARL